MRKKPLYVLSMLVSTVTFLLITIVPTLAQPQKTEPPPSEAVTSFVPLNAAYLHYACDLPYFSTDPAKSPTTLHVMNTDSFSTTIKLLLWDSTGGTMGNERALITHTLPALGSTIIPSEEISAALSTGVITGTGYVESNNLAHIACLVKKTTDKGSRN